MVHWIHRLHTEQLIAEKAGRTVGSTDPDDESDENHDHSLGRTAGLTSCFPKQQSLRVRLLRPVTVKHGP
jgi:hypothetical protein